MRVCGLPVPHKACILAGFLKFDISRLWWYHHLNNKQNPQRIRIKSGDGYITTSSELNEGERKPTNKKENKNMATVKKVSISQGNRKMGAIPSVSLPPIVTCKNCATCSKKCYAKKLCRIYPSVRDAYNRNLEILQSDREEYFRQVKESAKMSRYFRFHVSGDIVDIDYFDRMVKLARELKGTEFLVFTKNYEDVNEYLDTHKKPANLHLILSLPFTGATINNPHSLPMASVIMKGSEPRDDWKICGGNCTECACKGVGCWELKKGETIAFYEH